MIAKLLVSIDIGVRVLPEGTEIELLDLLDDNSYTATIEGLDVWFAVTTDQIEILPEESI